MVIIVVTGHTMTTKIPLRDNCVQLSNYIILVVCVQYYRLCANPATCSWCPSNSLCRRSSPVYHIYGNRTVASDCSAFWCCPKVWNETNYKLYFNCRQYIYIQVLPAVIITIVILAKIKVLNHIDLIIINCLQWQYARLCYQLLSRPNY